MVLVLLFGSSLLQHATYTHMLLLLLPLPLLLRVVQVWRAHRPGPCLVAWHEDGSGAAVRQQLTATCNIYSHAAAAAAFAIIAACSTSLARAPA
jgi:hypothetical protein